MSSTVDSTIVTSTTTAPAPPPTNHFVGQCKWFRDNLGYGFLTVVQPGPRQNEDIFVHHSGIHPKNSAFKSLTKGEYVRFEVESGRDGQPQAVNVTGLYGGTLLCDNAIYKRGGLPQAPY